MLIQIRDVDLKITPDTNVFVVQIRGSQPRYISRSYTDHEVDSFTSFDFEDAIIYFNRQSAVEAINNEFRYTLLPMNVVAVPINSGVKEDAKQRDAVKRRLKAEKRREKIAAREAERAAQQGVNNGNK